MPLHKITKGLELPITGAPKQEVSETVQVKRVAVVADDFVGMKPRMLVAEGESVKRGQPLFEDRKSPGTLFTSPGAGVVESINRGARRALQSVVIKLSESEASGSPAESEFQTFSAYKQGAAAFGRDELVALLVESGLWTSLRARPFSVVPAVDSTPAALFINAMDSNPLAAEPEGIVAARQADFDTGLKALTVLSEGKTFLCVRAGSPIKASASAQLASVSVEEFSGPHPSGTTGVHIHKVLPVHRERIVWSLNYQDVIAIGALVTTGKLDVERVVSLAGPPVVNPRLVKTRLGANLHDLVEGSEAVPQAARAISGEEPDVRVISGSALSGKRAQGSQFGYLGRYHLQVSLLTEGRAREFLGWLAPGATKFSIFNVFVSALAGRSKRFNMTTDTNGSPRAMVPIGQYERVMAMDILPTFLLRSLIVGDLEQAEKLGALELDEEDLALCTFVCPGKTNYGPILRANLDKIRLEG